MIQHLHHYSVFILSVGAHLRSSYLESTSEVEISLGGVVDSDHQKEWI